jgi:anti-anti-sigma factor
MEIKTVGDVKVAAMVPRFDAYSAKEVEAALKEIVESGAKKILCDFSNTEYISSAGLRVLLATAKSLQRADGKIALCALKPYVKEVFETAGFTQLFETHDSEEAALQSLV